MYLGIRDVCKRRLWKRFSLSIGAPLGNLKRTCFTGDFEGQMGGSGKGASFPVEALRGEPGGRAPLQGNLRVIQREGS